MKEELLRNNERSDTHDDARNKFVKYMFPTAIGVFGIAYSILTTLVYIDIHNIATNMTAIMDVINNTNATQVANVQYDLSLIKNCVLNRYCKRT